MAYIKKADRMTQLSETPTDEDLGIGEEIEAPTAPDLTALMATPEMQKMIADAVAARLVQMGAPQGAPAPGTEVFEAFTASIRHLIDVQSAQQPGYIKPLPADEVDRRLAGRVEMFALLAGFERKGVAPEWAVGEGGFFECTNALEFAPGEPIRTYLPPAEDFVPRNDEAHRVRAAMMQWLGVPTPSIGEQVEAAHKASKLPPLVSGALQPDRRSGLVERMGEPIVEPPKRRTMGTVVPERREVSPMDRASGPSGPVFADA